MSTPIIYSKSILLSLAFCLALLGNYSSVATGQDIQWVQNLDEAKAEAAKTNRLVWLHFAADWCVPCKRLDSFVFKNTGVIRTSDRNVVAVKIDVDKNDSLVRKLGVPRVPYDIVMTPGGETIINRPSPRNSSDYLKMFNGLDTPLQNLNAGNRESINAGISQIEGVLNKAGGLKQKSSDLDLEGPSHQMAATTVHGQRLERGLTSVERAAEVRAVEAKLLKQKAELFIAQEEQRSVKSQGPKIAGNPFYKGPNVGGLSANKEAAKLVSNRFMVEQKDVVQAQPAKPVEAASSFLPPNPPALASKKVEKVEQQVEVAVERGLSQFGESKEFSFPSLAGPADDAVAEKPSKPAPQVTQPKLTLPKFSAPKFAELQQPMIPEFKKRSEDKVEDSSFAYAPIDELKKALQSTVKPVVAEPKQTEEKVAIAVDRNPLRSAVATKTPVIETTNSPRPVAKLVTPVARPRPISTSVAVPQAPVVVEGVVHVVDTALPSVEGRLVAAEQPVDNDYRVKRQRAPAIPQQSSQTERLLDQVNFFEQAKPAPPATQVTIVQPQPVQQPQVVINLNTGAAAKAEPRNHGRIIQSGAVTQVAMAGNLARIKTPDVASAVRSKYALKGKCPVTLLNQGQWVDGKKEIGCVHRDRVYLFANVESREVFLSNPDQLSPLLAGFDPVIFEETGKLIEGEEGFGTFMGEAPNQRVVLFKTADTRDRFQKEPVKYLNVVRSAMTKNATKETKLR